MSKRMVYAVISGNVCATCWFVGNMVLFGALSDSFVMRGAVISWFTAFIAFLFLTRRTHLAPADPD
jgi:hypothetical protein